MDLPTFLLQCIAEDEAAARAATSAPWRWEIQGPYKARWGDEVRSYPGGEVLALRGAGDAVVIDPEASDPHGMELLVAEADRDHIARWDPARVLAECRAKRNIVQAYLDIPLFIRSTKDGGLRTAARMSRVGLETAMVALAQVYADRPGFQEEWKL